MHASILEFLEKALHRDEVAGKSVLEIGSLDINGSARPVFVKRECASYLGTDMMAGRGVDRVVQAEKILETFGPNSFDIVVSTEMLEHAADWKEAVRTMKAVVRPGGLLLVTTRSPGFPYHGYPRDYWRFTKTDCECIFKDMEILALELDDPSIPGVFLKARKSDPYVPANLDAILVARIEVPPKESDIFRKIG